MEKKESLIRQATTVGQVKEMLEDYTDDTPIFFACNYGDYHNTQQALYISEAEEVDSSAMMTSGYSHSGLAVDQDGHSASYCPACDEERENNQEACPCGSVRPVVDEGGNPVVAEEDDFSILILK